MRYLTMYMHTIDGRPASYSPHDRQIVFVHVLPGWQDRPFAARLAISVDQVEREQLKSVAMRKRTLKVSEPPGQYGYVVVRVSTAHAVTKKKPRVRKAKA